MVKPLRAGVIGLGVGERHIESYGAIDGVEVAAVCDLDPDRLREVADRQCVPGRYDDYREITESDDIDVVSICSYDDAHAQQAVSAFRHGKHVMVEKPVALTRSDAESVLEAQQASGKLISSNLILRASPRFVELRQWIREGRLGDVFAIEGDYLHEILWKITEGWRGQMDFYCVTYGGGIHLIDLMRWLLDDEVIEVAGMGTDLLTQDTEFAYPDTIVNLLKFSGGAVGKTMTTFGPKRPKFHRLDVFGTEASWVNGVPDGSFSTGTDPGAAISVMSAYPGMEKGDLLPEFVEAIRDGTEPPVGAEDVFRVMDVCFAAWESVRDAKTVKVRYQI